MVLIDNSRNPKAFTLRYNNITNAIICDVGITALRELHTIKESEILYLKALWDTGATNSVVTKDTAKRLGLVPTGKTIVHHAGGESEVNVFQVQLFLPMKVTVNARVTECDDSTQFGLIIGMDIICAGDFSITNSDGKTTFSFRMPSIEKIDYVKASGLPIIQKPIHVDKKIGRNDPCPCNSGKKFKHCCGFGKN